MVTPDAGRRRVEILRVEQEDLIELIAEVALLSGYWQGAAHACGCDTCRDISGEVAA